MTMVEGNPARGRGHPLLWLGVLGLLLVVACVVAWALIQNTAGGIADELASVPDQQDLENQLGRLDALAGWTVALAGLSLAFAATFFALELTRRIRAREGPTQDISPEVF